MFYTDKQAHIVYQMLEFLPPSVKDALKKLNISYLYELRIRENKPLTVNYQGKYRYLGEYGLTEHRQKALVCTAEEIADCVFRAGKYSVYSVEEQLKQGFITASQGERIGISGEYVFEKGQPLALRNFTSLCIRVPHDIKGSAKEVFEKCMSRRVQNVLLCSSPGLGKTTILRDLGRILSERTRKNLLICDERGEISAGELGESCDIMRYASKETAFEAGIRAMRPDIILTDELSVKDCAALEKAVAAGVIVVASAHFADISYIKSPFLGLFDRFVVLNEQEIGKIKGIYDGEGREIV